MQPVFERSHVKGKKYKVTFNYNGKSYIRHFGASGYEHYKDTTGLGLFSHLDHNDKKRRDNFRNRFRRLKDNPLSSGYWSYHYLW